MIDLMISGDYAVIEDGHLCFYYGYEETAPDGEWCFVVRQKRTRHELYRYPKSQLEAHAPRLQKYDEPCAYLLVGVALYYQEITP